MPGLGLGLGLGLGKSSLIQDPEKELIKLSSFYIDPDKPDGVKRPTLAPRTLPNGVENEEYVQHVSDDVVLKASDIVSISVHSDSVRANLFVDAFDNLINTGGEYEGTHIVTSISEPVAGRNVQTIYTHRQYSSSAWCINLPLGTTLEQAREILAGTVIRYQLEAPIDTLNESFVNPVVDQAGVVGNNLFDPTGVNPPPQLEYKMVSDGFTIKALGIDLTKQNIFPNIEWKDNTQYTFKGVCFEDDDSKNTRLSVYYTDESFESIFIPTLTETEFLYTSDENKTISKIYYTYSSGLGTTTVKNFQINEGVTALPYEPYGKANVLLQGFAETVDSGYKLETNNGKSFVMANFDGVNDYGSLVASEAPNPTGLQDFAFGYVFKTNTNPIGHFLYRGNDTGSFRQYAMYIEVGSIGLNLGGSAYTVSAVQTPVIDNTFYKVIWGRKNGNIFLKLNGVETFSEPNSINISSQEYVKLGARNATATTLTFFNNNDIGLSVYNDGVDMDKWEEAFDKVCAKKYGL